MLPNPRNAGKEYLLISNVMFILICVFSPSGHQVHILLFAYSYFNHILDFCGFNEFGDDAVDNNGKPNLSLTSVSLLS